jgi:hypothetical protein
MQWTNGTRSAYFAYAKLSIVYTMAEIALS